MVVFPTWRGPVTNKTGNVRLDSFTTSSRERAMYKRFTSVNLKYNFIILDVKGNTRIRLYSIVGNAAFSRQHDKRDGHNMCPSLWQKTTFLYLNSLEAAFIEDERNVMFLIGILSLSSAWNSSHRFSQVETFLVTTILYSG